MRSHTYATGLGRWFSVGAAGVLLLVAVFDPALAFAAEVASAPAVSESESLTTLRARAEKGDADAQYELGMCYALGVRVRRDKEEAKKWIRRAAEHGHVAATGLRFAAGYGVEKDQAEAVKWFQKGANAGHAGSQTLLGSAYRLGSGVPKDLDTAIQWTRKAAEQGNAVAQVQLSELIEERLSSGPYRISAEVKLEVVNWLRKAAEQGYSLSQSKIGKKYWDGDGVPQDRVIAMSWIRQSANLGDRDAEFMMGQAHFHGITVARSLPEAVSWYRKAAEQEHSEARFVLAVRYANGEGVPEDYAEAARLFKQAAAENMWIAVGLFRYREDAVEDAKWCRLAAQQGIMSSQIFYADQLSTGKGVTKNEAEAARWYQKAAFQGAPAAQYALALSYATGVGMPKDEIEALAWANVAAASGMKGASEFRDENEERLGRQIALLAQQRSKEIAKEIESAKAAKPPTLHYDPVQPSQPADNQPKASGSGSIVSASGHVLTAAHVVAGAASVKVVTAQGTKPATVVRVDEANDLAVLKIESGIFAPLPVVTSRKVRLGQTVATIGFPNIQIQGFSPKVTKGEISSLNGVGDDPRAWQISVPVQTGNSGGPLLDESGNLIGVVLSKLGMKAAVATGDLPQSVGYAVKSAYALALIEPYLDASAPEASTQKRSLEDMVAKAQQSVVLVLAY